MRKILDTTKKEATNNTSIHARKCISALRVTRYASRVDFPFKGNWLVNYDAKEFNYPDILLILARIQDTFAEKSINFNSINIIFNKKGTKNYYFKENGDVLLSFCDINAEFEEKGTKPSRIAAFKPLGKAIKTISLFFPRLESDPRWKTMGLPAGQLFLASSLKANGFEPTPLLLTLPGENRPSEAFAADMTGFSLYEDLLPALKPFLARFRASYGGIMAAGGPFPTLAPLAAIYQLPQVNLFVRGEAELALPGILQTLNQGDAKTFFAQQGIFWQQPGLVAMAGFDKVIRPDDFTPLAVDLDFLPAGQVEQGLEMNFSRGCRRGCVFCCRAQGSEFRKLSLEKTGELFKEYGRKISKLADDNAAARTVNINDDDILQDPAYAREIFDLIKKHGLRIFGVQTSTASLVRSDGGPDPKLLDLVSDPGLYVEDHPLLWLGTDAFLPARAQRLGKKFPSREKFAALLGEFEKHGLRHFHYWISSDGDSTWEEFVEELTLIFGFFRDFPGFGLLAHAPFIVPYPSSQLFGRLSSKDPRLKLKLALDAPDARFSYQVVDHLETKWPQLNNLLHNEKTGGEKGFFDFLKEKEFIAAAQLAYHFLKQEQLQSTVIDPSLHRARERLEKTIENLLELRDI